MSTNTGLAPAVTIDPTVAIKVYGTVITSSPAPILSAFNVKSKASVPLPTLMAYFAPVLFAKFFSHKSTSLPKV